MKKAIDGKKKYKNIKWANVQLISIKWKVMWFLKFGCK